MKLFSTKSKTSLSGDVVILSASKVVTYAISMVAAMLLSRFRTLEEYGTYSQILMVVDLFSTLLMMGLPSCINYFLARAESREERNKFLSVYYVFNTILGFLVGAVLVATIPLIELYFDNSVIGRYAYFIALYPWTKIITSSVENLLIVHKKSNILVSYRIIHSITIVGCILAVQWIELGFSAYILFYLIFEIIFSLVVIFFAIKLDGRLSLKIDWKLVKVILAFSIPLGLSTAAGTLKAEMDKFVIGYFFTTEQYAIYANAAKELPFNFIASSLTAVLLPVIARKIKQDNIDESIELWKETTMVSYLINAYFAIALFTFSKDAMTFLYSEKYAAGSMVFAIYSLVLLFRSTYFGMILQCTGNTKTILKSSIVSLVLNAVLNVVLYYMIGFEGPAVATILATLWNASYLLWNTHRVTNISIKKIFPWKEVGIISAVNVALACIFYLIKGIIPLELYLGESWESILLAAMWLIVYVLIFSKFIKEKLKMIKTYE